MLGKVVKSGATEVSGSVVVVEVAARDQGGAEGLSGALDQFADDHCGAAGDGWAGVGDMARVGLCDEDLVVGKAQGLGGDLAEDGVGALAELGGGRRGGAGWPSGVISISTRELRRRSLRSR